jgi:hypothetical protein
MIKIIIHFLKTSRTFIKKNFNFILLTYNSNKALLISFLSRYKITNVLLKLITLIQNSFIYKSFKLIMKWLIIINIILTVGIAIFGTQLSFPSVTIIISGLLTVYNKMLNFWNLPTIGIIINRIKNINVASQDMNHQVEGNPLKEVQSPVKSKITSATPSISQTKPTESLRANYITRLTNKDFWKFFESLSFDQKIDFDKLIRKYYKDYDNFIPSSNSSLYSWDFYKNILTSPYFYIPVFSIVSTTIVYFNYEEIKPLFGYLFILGGSGIQAGQNIYDTIKVFFFGQDAPTPPSTPDLPDSPTLPPLPDTDDSKFKI